MVRFSVLVLRPNLPSMGYGSSKRADGISSQQSLYFQFRAKVRWIGREWFSNSRFTILINLLSALLGSLIYCYKR
jgi:hypothetical protein